MKLMFRAEQAVGYPQSTAYTAGDPGRPRIFDLIAERDSDG